MWHEKNIIFVRLCSDSTSSPCPMPILNLYLYIYICIQSLMTFSRHSGATLNPTMYMCCRMSVCVNAVSCMCFIGHSAQGVVWIGLVGTSLQIRLYRSRSILYTKCMFSDGEWTKTEKNISLLNEYSKLERTVRHSVSLLMYKTTNTLSQNGCYNKQ